MPAAARDFSLSLGTRTWASLTSTLIFWVFVLLNSSSRATRVAPSGRAAVLSSLCMKLTVTGPLAFAGASPGVAGEAQAARRAVPPSEPRAPSPFRARRRVVLSGPQSGPV